MTQAREEFKRAMAIAMEAGVDVSDPNLQEEILSDKGQKEQTRSTLEKQTCPRRMGEFGPWKRDNDLDVWEFREEHRHCSFCGSLHPDEFKTFLEEACRNPGRGTSVTRSAKSYKWYVTHEGKHLKFYTPHIPSKEYAEELNAIIYGSQGDA